MLTVRNSFLLLVSLLLLLGVAWLQVAYRFEWGGVFMVLSGVALLLLFIPVSRLHLHADLRGRCVHVLSSLLRDPFFFALIGFLLLLVVQWLNAGLVSVYDYETERWGYSVPKWPSLPFAVNRSEAWEVLTWFVPAGVLTLLFRHSTRRRKWWSILMHAFMFNAVLLSMLGVAQLAKGTKSILWKFPQTDGFFATFAYANHAGTFFMLTLSMALACLVPSKLRVPNRKQGIFYATVIVFSLLGCCFSQSRISIAFAALLMVLAVGVYIRSLMKGLRLRRRAIFGLLKLTLVLSVLIPASAAVVMKFAGEDVKKEFRTMRLSNVTNDLSVRWVLVDAGFSAWKEHPWCGVGGWGFGYFWPLHSEPEHWQRANQGKANAHNDPVQFLVEFGLVGAGLMGVMGGAMAWPAWRRWRGRRRAHRVGRYGW